MFKRLKQFIEEKKSENKNEFDLLLDEYALEEEEKIKTQTVERSLQNLVDNGITIGEIRSVLNKL